MNKDRGKIVSIDEFAKQNWWTKLKANEQRIVEQESKQLEEEMQKLLFSGLQIGVHFDRLHKILEPKRLWLKYLKSHFNGISQKTVYRYIKRWENAKRNLPKPVLRIAAVRGMDICGDTDDRPLGPYTDIVKRMPPPDTESERDINEWLDRIEEKRLKRIEERRAPGSVIVEVGDGEEMAKDCYQLFVRCLGRLQPKSHKAKSAFVLRLSGLMFAKIGVSGVQSVEVVAIPPEFERKRGRPRKVIDIEAETA